MSTSLVLYDRVVADRNLSPVAKILYADVCYVTFTYRTRSYYFGSAAGARRIYCDPKTWRKARKELIAAGYLIERPGKVLTPRHKNGDVVSDQEHKTLRQRGSIPIFLDTIEHLGPAYALLAGLRAVTSDLIPAREAELIGLHRRTIYKLDAKLNKLTVEAHNGKLENSV